MAGSATAVEMSHSSNESDNGSTSTLKDQAESPSTDEGSCGGPAGSFAGEVGGLKKGPWTSAEDAILVDYVNQHGEGNWNAVQKHSGLSRCGKSCRLRWANHLRPNLKKGPFTPDEERLIVELHAKMGNKWAKMATQLPGRTDNEIKNYWNTRIKRRQRAGLPLYPSDISRQSWNEKQSQSSSEFSAVDKWNNELMKTSSYDIPDVIFDNFKASEDVLSYIPPFSEMSVSSMLNQGLSAQNYGLIPQAQNCIKRFRESETFFPSFYSNTTVGLTALEQFAPSEKIHRSFGTEFPYDPDPGSKHLVPLGAVASGSHAPPNDNISTSQTVPVSVKLELPSLQYPETDLNRWHTHPLTPSLEAVDAYVESSPAVSVQSDPISPPKSGLLEALIHEAQGTGNAKSKPSEKSSNSYIGMPSDFVEGSAFNLSGTEWGGYPVSPVGCSTAVFNACTPTSGISMYESSPRTTSPSLNIKPEPVEHVEETKNHPLGFCGADASLGSHGCSSVPIDHTVSDAETLAGEDDVIASLLGEDLCGDHWCVPAGPSTLGQGLVGLTCLWHNMPPVCPMSELP